MALKPAELRMRVLDCNIAVHCADETAAGLLRDCYSEFLLAPQPESPADLAYDISSNEGDVRWTIRCEQTRLECRDSYDLVYEFEKDMTQRVQLLRSDLYFIHAAALAVDETCIVISGASGSGKSSLAWFMSHNGCDYLSDELAPIAPDTLHVSPYPHALCLKNEPLSAPELPESAIYTGATIHVPACELPKRALDASCRLGLLVYIDDSAAVGSELKLQEMGPAESAAHLYANGLNQLAHERFGLSVVAEISRSVSACRLSGGSVEQRAAVIRDQLSRVSSR